MEKSLEGAEVPEAQGGAVGKGLKEGQARKKSREVAKHMREQTLAACHRVPGLEPREGGPGFPHVVWNHADTRGEKTVEFGAGLPGRKPWEASLCTTAEQPPCRAQEE